MSYPRTLGQLTASVRELGQYDETDANTDAISGPFLVRQAARNYKHTYELLAEADPDRLTVTSGTVVQSATGSLPLPGDMYRLRWIDVSYGGDWLRLERDTPSLLTAQPWESASGGGVPCRYRLEGSNAYVDPPIAANTSLRVTYIPAPSTLTGSDDPVDGVGGCDDLIVFRTLRDCRLREDLPTVDIDASIAEETARVNRMTRDRDYGQPIRLESPRHGGWFSSSRRRRRRWP